VALHPDRLRMAPDTIIRPNTDGWRRCRLSQAAPRAWISPVGIARLAGTQSRSVPVSGCAWNFPGALHHKIGLQRPRHTPPGRPTAQSRTRSRPKILFLPGGRGLCGPLRIRARREYQGREHRGRRGEGVGEIRREIRGAGPANGTGLVRASTRAASLAPVRTENSFRLLRMLRRRSLSLEVTGGGQSGRVGVPPPLPMSDPRPPVDSFNTIHLLAIAIGRP
jgi:hypothetical protein